MSLADVLGFSQAQDWQGPCKFSLQDMIPGFLLLTLRVLSGSLDSSRLRSTGKNHRSNRYVGLINAF